MSFELASRVLGLAKSPIKDHQSCMQLTRAFIKNYQHVGI